MQFFPLSCNVHLCPLLLGSIAFKCKWLPVVGLAHEHYSHSNEEARWPECKVPLQWFAQELQERRRPQLSGVRHCPFATKEKSRWKSLEFCLGEGHACQTCGNPSLIFRSATSRGYDKLMKRDRKVFELCKPAKKKKKKRDCFWCRLHGCVGPCRLNRACCSRKITNDQTVRRSHPEVFHTWVQNGAVNFLYPFVVTYPYNFLWMSCYSTTPA